MSAPMSDRELQRRLRELSGRIRGMRAQRGMTRKRLARDSGISERYLARLETGGANPSVVVLWKLAEAMEADFSNLVLENAAAPPAIDRCPFWPLPA